MVDGISRSAQLRVPIEQDILPTVIEVDDRVDLPECPGLRLSFALRFNRRPTLTPDQRSMLTPQFNEVARCSRP